MIEKDNISLNEQEKRTSADLLQRQFVNMVSHEFRTPLSIIDGNAQIIEKRGNKLSRAELSKRARTIRSAVSRMIGMMEAVLSTSMLRTGQLKVEFEKLDAIKLLQDICAEYQELVPGSSITTDLRNLPAPVIADKKILTIVVSNLLSNALKFADKPSVVKVTGWQDGNAYKFRVEDNGMGIPENELPKIFERYFRASTASGIPGSGIGLSLVKELLDICGGSIDVRSVQGKGSRFVFSMPVPE